MSLLKKVDPAHELLIPFLQESESLLRSVLKKLDKQASCRVIPAVDLGFPHDVCRIAGGFATGVFVDWQCSVPFVPIDTAVNIDTSSIFRLKDDVSEDINERTFEALIESLEKSSYIFNFHKGNHFISFGVTYDTNEPMLIIHSNEKEFKYQFNGLIPTKNNWYANKIKIESRKDRYIRYITGETAEIFIDIAKSLEDFNVIRHRFVAYLLTEKLTRVLSQSDHHHYYMPTRQSVAMGCFPVSVGEVIPVFSRPGRDIYLFEPHSGGGNHLGLSEGMEQVLVPHGWGKTCLPNTKFQINVINQTFILSGQEYPIEPLVSLGKDERLWLRDFHSEPNHEDSFFMQMKHHSPGRVVGRIKQLASFTKNGFCRHE